MTIGVLEVTLYLLIMYGGFLSWQKKDKARGCDCPICEFFYGPVGAR